MNDLEWLKIERFIKKLKYEISALEAFYLCKKYDDVSKCKKRISDLLIDYDVEEYKHTKEYTDAFIALVKLMRKDKEVGDGN